MKFADLSALLTNCPFQIETKGGMEWFRSKRIIFTSIKNPKDVYNKVGEDLYQLIRRIDKIKIFD
jgi:hypothetical protein